MKEICFIDNSFLYKNKSRLYQFKLIFWKKIAKSL